jgi:hypothetical protein
MPDIGGANRWRRHLCGRGPVDGRRFPAGLGHRCEAFSGRGTEGFGSRAGADGANTPEDVKKVLQQASMVTRVGADPEKDPCGASAILRTKRYRLEAFGRQEAAESKKRKMDVRMPEEFIKKVVDMPNMEIEVQLCGDDEYFAEGALIELQQGSKRIKPIDIGKAERGRKNEGSGPTYRSRFTALFAYEKFDPTAACVFVVNLQDGSEARVAADLSKVK